MKEYIEKAVALEALSKSGVTCNMRAHKIVASIQAADVAEVRHGRWMTTDAYPHHLYCSVCYKTYAKNAKWVNELDLPTNYCPNCGARMDKEDEHEISQP